MINKELCLNSGSLKSPRLLIKFYLQVKPNRLSDANTIEFPTNVPSPMCNLNIIDIVLDDSVFSCVFFFIKITIEQIIQ